MGFMVEFRSPYFHIPVSVDKSQIGLVTGGHRLEPGAFRLFDWQTWAHIDGTVEWHGEHRTRRKGRQLDLITGFSYRVPRVPDGVGNLGLRLAEGTAANVRIACGRGIARVGFEPVFWLLEATLRGYRPVPIRTNRLMGLIVSLFDLGRGAPHDTGEAVVHLRQWAEGNLGSAKPFTGTREFLRYIRDWAPLGMEPLYQGILEVMKQLQVVRLERELFEFVADNWGVWNNPRGRLLAIRLLDTLNTQSANEALQAIYEYVSHGGITDEERSLLGSLAAKGAAGGGATETPT